MEPLVPASRGTSVSPLSGPVDRESFFEARRRHRLTTWHVSAVSIMGIPLGLALTPVLYTLVLLLAHIVDPGRPHP